MLFAPSCFRGFKGYFAALFRRHGGKTAFSADLSALASHSGHDAGYIALGDFCRTVIRSCGTVDHLKRGLIYVFA